MKVNLKEKYLKNISGRKQMTYSDLIGVKEQFRNSVNIEYDLMDFKKIAEYIPTEDICEVIKYYFDCIEDSHFNRATILEGPYGKGKSYLVLSMTYPSNALISSM